MSRKSPSNRLAAGFVFVAVGAGSFVVFNHYRAEADSAWTSAKSAVRGLLHSESSVQPHMQVSWPPSVGQPYPDLALVDQDGRRTSLSEFRGKVILIEPIGMPCRACVAFAGGHERGPFDGIGPQEDLQSIETYARQYGGVDLNDERIVIVQILFYSKDMTAPAPEDARRWAQHFGMDRASNRVVLAAEPQLLGQVTHSMIPGFQLIDKDFVLRLDSTGHNPRHDLYTELLPGISKLVAE